LTEYDTWETLAPFLGILKQFDHDLWLVTTSILSQVSVLELANRIRTEIIQPNAGNPSREREITHLSTGATYIEQNHERKRRSGL
jgi:hypothetical protein